MSLHRRGSGSGSALAYGTSFSHSHSTSASSSPTSDAETSPSPSASAPTSSSVSGSPFPHPHMSTSGSSATSTSGASTSTSTSHSNHHPRSHVSQPHYSNTSDSSPSPSFSPQVSPAVPASHPHSLSQSQSQPHPHSSPHTHHPYPHSHHPSSSSSSSSSHHSHSNGPTVDELRLKSSLKSSSSHHNHHHSSHSKSHRVTLESSYGDQDEPDPEMFRDPPSRSSHRHSESSYDRRPSESKYRRRSFRRTCTNGRIAVGVLVVVLIVLMCAVVVRIRQVPVYHAPDGTSTTTAPGAGANGVSMSALTSQGASCPPPNECPIAPLCPDCTQPSCAPCPSCDRCPACPVASSSPSSSDASGVQAELDKIRLHNAELVTKIALLEKALLNAGGNPNVIQFTPLVTATAPPTTQKGKLVGAGDPFLVHGEDADIAVETHLVTWEYCTINGKIHDALALCPNKATSEQGFQLSFYDQFDAKGHVVPLSKRPSYPTCIQRIPPGYIFPSKVRPPLPHQVGVEHWGNFGADIHKLDDLIIFNPTALKNLYHFDSSRYDYDFEHHIRFGAKYIPLGTKVRLALDVGSGGGSFGLWLKQKYDIQTLSIAFPDWPYCEYISMRGNLCMYIDAFHAMPFSKFTFDLVHVSWIYHSLDPPDMEKAFLEIYRITRPGGYMWLQDGHSRAQVATMQRLIKLLGLVKLFEHSTPHKGETNFGNQPYQLQWWTILLKPIREHDFTGNGTACTKM